jgi:Flp pilus assembly protein TadG
MKSRTIWACILRVFPKPAHSRFFSIGLHRRGQASLEMLIVLLFLIPLIFGAIELSRAVSVRAALDSGIGVAVRALSLDTSLAQWDWATIKTQEAVDQNVFGDSGVGTVQFTLTDGAGGVIDQPALEASPYGFRFCLTGSVGFTLSVPLIDLDPTGPDEITISVKHCGIVERM